MRGLNSFDFKDLKTFSLFILALLTFVLTTMISTAYKGYKKSDPPVLSHKSSETYPL